MPHIYLDLSFIHRIQQIFKSSNLPLKWPDCSLPTFSLSLSLTHTHTRTHTHTHKHTHTHPHTQTHPKNAYKQRCTYTHRPLSIVPDLHKASAPLSLECGRWLCSPLRGA